jgi:phage gp45-like
MTPTTQTTANHAGGDVSSAVAVVSRHGSIRSMKIYAETAAAPATNNFSNQLEEEKEDG